jgi:TonB family protein
MKAKYLVHGAFGVLCGLSTTVEVWAEVPDTNPASAAGSEAETRNQATTKTQDQPTAETHAHFTRPPKLKHFVAAGLSRDALNGAEAASVTLELAIDAEGVVREVVVTGSAGPVLDQAAVAAAEQFTFEPAEIDGKPAGVRIGYRYDFSVLAEARPAEPTKSQFSGVVRNRKTKAPLASVAVEIDSGQRVQTDEQGRFVFEAVEPGEHSVFIRVPGLSAIGTEETIAPGSKYVAEYAIDIPDTAAKPDDIADFELVVFAPRLDKKVAATEVAAEQGAKVAGTGGDAIKVVENLPGVARTAVGSGALVVWGASAEDTRIYVDGVRIPVLYHQGGYRSVIHSDLVRSVELQPGGYGSNYGRGLGGLVTVGLRPMQAEGLHGSVGADVIDASASVRGNVGEHWRFAAAGRKSHLDWALRQVTNEDPGQYVPIPRYWDGQVRLAYVPREGESVEMSALGSHDEIDRVQTSADPADTRRERRTSGFSRYFVRYKKELGEASFVSVTPWFGFDRSDISNEVGVVPATQNSRNSIWGARAEWTGRLSKCAVLNLGMDGELVNTSVSRNGSVTTPAREGDIRVFGQPPSNQVAYDEWTTTIASLAPFAQIDLSPLGDSFHVIPGVRFEPTITRASRSEPSNGSTPARGVEQMDAPVDPRLALRWQVSKRLLLKSAFGVYHQPPVSEDMSATFGNPRPSLSRAVHYLVGANYQISEPLTVEVTSFYSHMDSLTVRNPSSAPARTEALLSIGEGRAYGTQLMLRHNPIGRFFGWASLSVIRSERLDPATSRFRPFDFDQTYVLTLVGSYDLGRGFELGARARWSTGYPRTPVIGANYDARSDGYQPVFGAINSSRIPNFYQIDVRGTKRFKLGKTSELEVYLDVQNVTDHRNPEEVVYNYNYSKKYYITGLPILPVLGAKLSW